MCCSCFHNSTGYGECLLDKPSGRIYGLSSQLPGLMYDVNKQCELMFGLGSQVCPYLVSEQCTDSCFIGTKNYWDVGLKMKSQPVHCCKNFIWSTSKFRFYS